MRNHENRSINPEGKMNRSTALFAVLFLGLSVGACGLLDVSAPGVVDADDLTGPESAEVLVSGTISDFECAFGAYVVNQGLLGNELRDASVTAGRFPLDRRDLSETGPYGVNSCAGNPPGIYRPLSTARWSADNAIARLDGWTDAEVPNRTGLIGQASAHGGYTLVLMGEGFCSMVIEEEGPEVQPEAAFEAAVARFTRAIESATVAEDDDTRLFALLGRARAHLNLGNTTQAAADAAAVLADDPEFERIAGHSTASARRWNRVGDEFSGGRITVDPSYRDLAVEGEPDTRVEILDTGTLGHDTATPVFLATKIGPSRSTALRSQPLTVASFREAHLIIAEVEGGEEAVARINLLRGLSNLPEFDSTDEAEIQEQVIEERARELFLEGHHLNDLRRFNLDQTPAPGEAYRQGGIYGSVRCFALPEVERNNNPNVS